LRSPSEGLPLPKRASTIAGTPATARATKGGERNGAEALRPRDTIKVKDGEEYLEDFREIRRILGEEFV